MEGKVGFFPSDYVEIIDDTMENAKAEATTGYSNFTFSGLNIVDYRDLIF